MNLGIAIVSYNTRQITSDCLASVQSALQSDGIDGGIWVVDNASVDGSAEMIRTIYPAVHLIASAENLGFAGGTNAALCDMLASDSPPRFVLLLNPDTLVYPGSLAAMLDVLEQSDADVAGANLTYGDGSFQHGAFHFPTLWMAFFDFWPLHYRLIESQLNGRYPRHLYEGDQPFVIDHPLGAAFMTRTHVLEEIGLLDEGYFMYCEEIDWSMRAHRAGYKIVCVPTAHITHLGGQSASQFRDKMFVALWKSRFRLFEKHYSRLYQHLVRCIVHAGLRRDVRRVQNSLLAGEMTASEAESRIYAYHQVMEM